MKVIKKSIADVIVFEPKVYGDERGFFFESFNQKIFEEAVGYKVNFVQDNHSKSSQGVLRGLHYQLSPCAQGKLVRCVSGEVFDVAVDMRHSSPTFGKWVGAHLSAENKKQMWIPEGFAHGFLVLSDIAEFVYKSTDFYMPTHERAVAYDDPDIAIDWPDVGKKLNLSEKDKIAKKITEISKDEFFL